MGDTGYFWIVLCKNHKLHKKQNLFFGHRIPLGETDAISPPPEVNGKLKILCDNCGEEFAYKAKDLLRAELEFPDGFTPHPLFE